MTETQASRLPPSFHASFLPERLHLRELLRFAADEGEGTKEEIQEATYIPTGDSSGKVVPTLRYAEGMGLVTIGKPGNSVYAPRLTPFGRVVYEQDPGLGSVLTQVLAHLHLCRREGGAEVWYRVFTTGFERLGLAFHERDVEEHLRQTAGGAQLGPLARMYSDSGSFGKAALLLQEADRFRRAPAPTADYYGPAYAYLATLLWRQHFGDERQVTASQFEAETKFFAMAGWDWATGQRVLDLLDELGALRVDRRLQDAALAPLVGPEAFLATLYDGLP